MLKEQSRWITSIKSIIRHVASSAGYTVNDIAPISHENSYKEETNPMGRRGLNNLLSIVRTLDPFPDRGVHVGRLCIPGEWEEENTRMLRVNFQIVGCVCGANSVAAAVRGGTLPLVRISSIAFLSQLVHDCWTPTPTSMHLQLDIRHLLYPG